MLGVDAFVGLFLCVCVCVCVCFVCCFFFCFFAWVDILHVMVRLGRRPPAWKMAVHMAATDVVFGGV